MNLEPITYVRLAVGVVFIIAAYWWGRTSATRNVRKEAAHRGLGRYVVDYHGQIHWRWNTINTQEGK